MAKAPKSPGKSCRSYVDFLGQTILRGDHVLVGQRDGNHDRMWSAEVLDINVIENASVRLNYSTHPPTQIPVFEVSFKLLVRPTGAYRGFGSHVWKWKEDIITGDSLLHDYPRSSWLNAEKAVRSPVKVHPIFGGDSLNFRTEPQEIA